MEWLTAMEAEEASSIDEFVELSSLPLSSQEGYVPTLTCLFELRSGVIDRGARNTLLVGVERPLSGEGGSEYPDGWE